MTPLRNRTLTVQDQKLLQQYPMLRGFHAPQRDRVKQPMPKRASS